MSPIMICNISVVFPYSKNKSTECLEKKTKDKLLNKILIGKTCHKKIIHKGVTKSKNQLKKVFF
jgi:hypothetical protein